MVLISTIDVEKQQNNCPGQSSGRLSAAADFVARHDESNERHLPSIHGIGVAVADVGRRGH
jgi:hypothetical protein